MPEIAITRVLIVSQCDVLEGRNVVYTWGIHVHVVDFPNEATSMIDHTYTKSREKTLIFLERPSRIRSAEPIIQLCARLASLPIRAQSHRSPIYLEEPAAPSPFPYAVLPNHIHVFQPSTRTAHSHVAATAFWKYPLCWESFILG